MTVGSDELRALWVIGHRVTPIPVGGRIAALEIVTPPNVPGPPPHHHEDAAEFFFVTAGQLGVMAGDIWTSLGLGGYATVPQGVVHSFRNEGTDEVRFITGYEPQGFERFFLEFGVDASEPGAFETSVSEQMIGRVVEGCARFGMILAPEVQPAVL